MRPERVENAHRDIATAAAIDDAPRTLVAMGIHGQGLWVDRPHRLMIAKLPSQPTPLDLEALVLAQSAVPELPRCRVTR